MGQLINGKDLADNILSDLSRTLLLQPDRPGLAAILVGDDEPSEMYVRLKEKACHRVGIDFHKYLLPADATMAQLLELIDFLNTDPGVHGIILQLPLPDHLNADEAVARIATHKDADGFTPSSLQQYQQNQGLAPTLVEAILELITSTGQSLTNTTSVILGKSPAFTQPLQFALAQAGSTVTVSDDLNPEAMRQADVMVTALGEPLVIHGNFIKPNAIVIDVGITKLSDGQIVGDVEPGAITTAGWLTPVPGGVGPMTIATLLRRVVYLWEQSQKA